MKIRQIRRMALAAGLTALLFFGTFAAASLAAVQTAGPARVQTIVIDPGHGGIETGAKGKFGNLEKDITLAVALKLKALIEKNLGLAVFLTRDRDVDVSNETRAATANNHKAGLFISIHANGAVQRKAAGSETFFLSVNATDEETRRLAYLENNSSELQNRIDPSSDSDLMM
ncbi:MAG TPA: N-acetylmuramoyl-L-alanine amidase, partial [Acidobacteriota bacterium]|nr:N-acetylmuramoyl-L-alanine amidase [Acidobacteriota bacterium]